LALFSVRSVPFSLGSQNNVECESVGFVFLTISLCDVYTGCRFSAFLLDAARFAETPNCSV